MPQVSLTLIRHGQPAAGRDPALTDRGRQQAAAAAAWLKDQAIGTIYHSTMQRASQTAAIIAETLPDAPLIADERLCEGVPTIPPQYSALFANSGPSERRLPA